VALADGDQVGCRIAGLGECSDEAMSGGEDGGWIVFRGITEVLLGRSIGGVGGGGSALSGAEAGDQPRVGTPGRDGDDPWG